MKKPFTFSLGGNFVWVADPFDRHQFLVPGWLIDIGPCPRRRVMIAGLYWGVNRKPAPLECLHRRRIEIYFSYPLQLIRLLNHNPSMAWTGREWEIIGVRYRWRGQGYVHFFRSPL